jgi:hypothetical protein
VDSTGNLNITPLTTLLSNGISAESIRDILSTYAAITIDANDMMDDPMLGLVLTEPDSIARIRGAICTYALIQIISYESGVNGNFDIASIEGNTTIEAALGYMGAAVRNSLSDDMLDKINLGLSTGETTIHNALQLIFPTATINVNFPNATANDVANSAFAITRYVIDRAITNSPTFDPCVAASTIETLGQNVGMRYYMASNQGATLVTITGLAPYPITTSIYDAIVSGECRDGSNVVITSFEVNSTTEAFIVNDYGSIEVVWHSGP